MPEDEESVAAFRARHACCEAHVPGLSFTRPEGERWTCPTCGAVWEYWIEEAEGSGWSLVRDVTIHDVERLV